MGFFDEEKNVQEYLKMTNGFDGAELIKILQRHLPKDSSVIELGMGPGKDLDILNTIYKATGSDSSQVFVDRYIQEHGDADILLLDAVSMDIDRTFDCIYSNKVLHHLTKAELKQSFSNQAKRLQEGGLLFHSFWYGDKIEEHHGLRFVYYTEEGLKDIIGNEFEIIETQQYKELKDNDSFYVVLRGIKN